MLKLKEITKVYSSGDTRVEALKGIDISFRTTEFVSILGPSGCGKTTLLNIVGGLDKYTSGDLKINGKSTKDFTDRDWDSYRNHSIGFVFQSYNLIPHQSVLSNVELALTLSGVSKAERRRRAVEALERVGLGNQLRKRPSEMSGGQMQRVAIARAIVNDPDIILADEPTGALDTETSVQVMEILKEISKDRLVIMVTHNPELAEKYSTRIIRMLDGKITGDTNPLTDKEIANEESRESAHLESKGKKKEKKPSMSFATSFGLSLRNLFTKKGRTALTSFAGSIGIIGIALIMAVSEGMTAYINHVQETTLSSYPLTIEEQTMDMSALMESFMSVGSGIEHDTDAVYKDPIIADMVDALSKLETSENDLTAFKAYIESELSKENSPLKEAVSGVQYTYAVSPTIYTKNADGEIIKSDTGELMREMLGDFMLQVSTGEKGEDAEISSSSSMMPSPMMGTMMMSTAMWQELLPDLEEGDPINDMLEEQYEVVYGAWPNEKDEIVLVLNERNELDDLTLYALGLLGRDEIDAIIDAAASGKTLEANDRSWSYEEICDMTFKVIMPYDFYIEVGGVYVDMSSQPAMMESLFEDAFELRVVGIIRPDPEAENAMLTGSIGYTHKLTEHVLYESASSDVVRAQLDSPDKDVFSGLPFESNIRNMTDADKMTEFLTYAKGLDTEAQAELFFKIQCLIAEEDGLEAGVKQAFESPEMQDRDALIAMISQSVAEEMGADPAQIEAYFEKTTLDELQELLRPAIEERVRGQIAMQVEAGLVAQFGPADSPEMRAAALNSSLEGYTEAQCVRFYDELTVFSSVTYEDNLKSLGYIDLDEPSTVNLYASTFENKDVITAAISDYNDSAPDEKKIAYTDYLGIMMSSITTIINAITYVLIAFVAVSLIVSSIMIGVITLISVQERTKEIGILRSIGASKRNVSSMFNAETVIIGFSSGLLGVLLTYLLCIPINLILNALTGIPNLKAYLPIPAAIALVVISVMLTLISGIIPSRSAAKKDPVVALRTE